MQPLASDDPPAHASHRSMRNVTHAMILLHEAKIKFTNISPCRATISFLPKLRQTPEVRAFRDVPNEWIFQYRCTLSLSSGLWKSHGRERILWKQERYASSPYKLGTNSEIEKGGVNLSERSLLASALRLSNSVHFSACFPAASAKWASAAERVSIAEVVVGVLMIFISLKYLYQVDREQS